MQNLAKSLRTAEHWRKRAEEARVIADSMENAEARASMLMIAADYDKLAKSAPA
jgi:hypothetical protein